MIAVINGEQSPATEVETEFIYGDGRPFTEADAKAFSYNAALDGDGGAPDEVTAASLYQAILELQHNIRSLDESELRAQLTQAIAIIRGIFEGLVDMREFASEAEAR